MKRTMHAGAWGLALLLLAAGCAWQGRANSAAISNDLAAGQRFILKDTDGNNVSLDEMLKTHKAVLLNFWATWCPHCQDEIPDLIRLQNQFTGRSFTVLGVDVGESQTKAAAYGRKAGIHYPLLLDGDQRVSEAYRVVGIPTSFLLASGGKMVGVYHAADEKLFADVEKTLNN